jgi:predicted RNA-binding Zn-ribbon protein involved in translation (DUF1610 family)
MRLVRFVCTSCQRAFDISDKYAGRKVKCPGCGAVSFFSPPQEAIVPQHQETPIPVEPAQARETNPCPHCGEEILVVAKKCKHCNEFLYAERPSQHNEPMANRPPSSAHLAAGRRSSSSARPMAARRNGASILIMVGLIAALIVGGVLAFSAKYGKSAPGSASISKPAGGTTTTQPSDVKKEPLASKALSQLSPAQMGETFRKKVEQDIARFKRPVLKKGDDGKLFMSSWDITEVSFDVKHNSTSVMLPYYGVLSFDATPKMSLGYTTEQEARTLGESTLVAIIPVSPKHVHKYQWQPGEGWVFSGGQHCLSGEIEEYSCTASADSYTPCGCPEGNLPFGYKSGRSRD